MLEVIEQPRVCRVAVPARRARRRDEIADVEAASAAADAEPVRYLHPERRAIHLLDKVISFDDAQEAVYRLPPPLIVVGSAGSGKTALTLEKLKHAEGEVLYVTHSAYLARNARDLYYAHGFEHAARMRDFCRTASSSRPSAYPPGARPVGATSRALVRALQQAGLQGDRPASGVRGDPRRHHGRAGGCSRGTSTGARRTAVDFRAGASGAPLRSVRAIPGLARRKPSFTTNLVAHEWRRSPRRATTSSSSMKSRTSPPRNLRWSWRR